MTKPNETLLELWFGSAAFTLVALLAAIWFVKDKTAYALGILLGCLVSCYLAYHMARNIEKALDNEAGAERIMRISSLLRYGLIVLVLIAAYYVPYVNPIATFVGLMGLKVAAYLQPFTHKIFSFFHKKEEEVQE